MMKGSSLVAGAILMALMPLSARFSIAMNIQKRPATEEELKALREIIASLWMMKG